MSLSQESVKVEGLKAGRKVRPEVTAIRVHWGTKWKIRKLKVHPKETEEMVLKRLIRFYEENAKTVQKAGRGEGPSQGGGHESEPGGDQVG